MHSSFARGCSCVDLSVISYNHKIDYWLKRCIIASLVKLCCLHIVATKDFPSHSGWSGHVDDIELCEEQQQESEAGESRGAFPILAREVSNQIGESGDAESPQYGGHDEEWLDEELASQFKCLICHLVCRDAVMHACRAIFCESCWNFFHASDDRCPSCRERERPAQQAYQQQWDIGKLQMICSKCGDSFPLAEKPKHSDECSHRETTCSECGMQVNLRHLEMHQEEECEARPVPCEVCGQKIPRSSLAEHMESAWKEHMVALVKEVKMLRTEVKDLRAEVRRQEPSWIKSNLGWSKITQTSVAWFWIARSTLAGQGPYLLCRDFSYWVSSMKSRGLAWHSPARAIICTFCRLRFRELVWDQLLFPCRMWDPVLWHSF